MFIKYALRLLSTLYPPQKPLVFTGADSALKLADLLLASGQRRPLIVTDGFLSSMGMLTGVLAHLEQGGAEAVVFDGVTPNPTFAVVEAGLELSRRHGCDSVLVVGGGSAIDAAKVIAAASTDPRRVDDLAGILKVKAPPLPLYAVPTTSGTGSEVTTAAVISDDETHRKRFFVDPKYIPIGAALDPVLLASLPPHITAATGMDALTHAIEAYTSQNTFADTDRDARLAVKLLFEYLPVAYADGRDAKAREMVALASFLAGYAFTRSSLGYVHAISHQVSAQYGTPHGLANAVILPRVMRFNRAACAARYAELSAVVDGEAPPDAEAGAARFIELVDGLAVGLGIPENLDGLAEEDFGAIAAGAVAEARSSYAVPRRMKRRHIEAVLQSVRGGARAIEFA